MRHLTAVFMMLFALFVSPAALANETPSCSRVTTGSPTEHAGDPAWLKVGQPDPFGNFTWCKVAGVAVESSHAEPAPVYTTYEKMVAVSWAASPELKTELPTEDPRRFDRVTSTFAWESRPREKRWSKTGTIYGGWLLGTTAGDVYRTFGAMDAGATEGSLLFAGESKGAVLAGELLISAVVWEGSRFLRNTSCGRAGVFPKIGCFLGHALPISAGGFRIAAAKHNHNMEKRLRE